jgi:hypothetical protein
VQASGEDGASALAGMAAGKPMTQPQLATALKPFRIRPTTIRDGDSTPKGYERAAFKEAWSRYLPETDTQRSAPNGGSESQHRNKPRIFGDSGELTAATPDGVLRHQNSLTPAENLGCCGVAAVGPLYGTMRILRCRTGR